MTLRHLRIFLSVCDHGCSTTKAADALHITQPAVSLAIRELESHYKVSFFERVGRRLVLNDSGQRLRQYALQITALFDAMEDELCAPLPLVCGLAPVSQSVLTFCRPMSAYFRNSTPG